MSFFTKWNCETATHTSNFGTQCDVEEYENTDKNKKHKLETLMKYNTTNRYSICANAWLLDYLELSMEDIHAIYMSNI